MFPHLVPKLRRSSAERPSPRNPRINMAATQDSLLPSAEVESVFAYLSDEPNATVAVQVAEIDETTAAIRALEEITRQVDTPYVGTYLS